MEVSKSTAMGEGLSKAKAGIPAVFQIKSIDRLGNKRTAGKRPYFNPQRALRCWCTVK